MTDDNRDDEAVGSRFDVIVVGSGNAALSAAISAREAGQRVVVLEKAPEPEGGGNSRFTGGLFRAAYAGEGDLRRIVEDLSQDDLNRLAHHRYDQTDYLDDIERLTKGEADMQLARVYVERSLETLEWLRSAGVRFSLGGRHFHGAINPGAAIWVDGGGVSLVEAEKKRCGELGVSFVYGAQVVALLRDREGITGVTCRDPQGGWKEFRAGAVILACGGFEASARLRVAYLGPEWENARVRGTPYNTGDLLAELQGLGVRMTSGWSDCHASPIDVRQPTPEEVDRAEWTARHDYAYGIMVNLNGQRFIDEGEDFRLFTYAKTGRALLHQPDARAFQVFDATRAEFLDKGYAQGTVFHSESLDEAAAQAGIDKDSFLTTVSEFNRASAGRGEVDFSIKDGTGTGDLSPPKSNWARPIESPPFSVYPVTCGITFTYGGVQTNESARVLDGSGKAIQGLFAVGELQGGLFRHNYPGGAGLMKGAVFGRLAGQAAATG